MKTPFNKTVFNSKIRSIGNYANQTEAFNNNVQTVIEMGFDKLENNSDTSYLSRAVNAVIKAKKGKTLVIEYIRDHANVIWQDAKDKKSFKGDKGEGDTYFPCVNEPTEAWYDRKKETQVDLIKRAKSLHKALEADNLAEYDPKALVAELRAIIKEVS